MPELSEKIKIHLNGLKENFPERRKEFFKWAYKRLSSITTSVYLLGLMAIFYVIGTIFPQGENIDEYTKAGGKFLFFVKAFRLLDLFASPLFILLSFIFLLNLVICSYERYLALFAKRIFPKAFTPTHKIYLTQNVADAHTEVRRIFNKDLGFRVVSKDEDWIVMERGLPYRWLTWLYHAGIVICFLGFILTYLFAFEGSMTLSPKKAETVTPDTTGRFMSIFKSKASPTDFHLYLEDFTTEYYQAPHLDYPKDELSRLAMGLGWKPPSFEMKEDSLAVKEWRARVKVIKGKSTLYQKTVRVNDPMRYGGYTFYQVGYEQKLKIKIDDNPILLEAKADEDTFIPGADATLKFGTFRSGTLYRLDGGIEKLVPFTIIKHPVSGEEGKYEELGKLELGSSIDINGSRVTLSDFEESAELSYRYDPGVGILWWGGIFVLIAMCLRFFGLYYFAAYNINESDEIICLELYLYSKGLAADDERVVKALEHHLTKNDLKPNPIS